MPSQDSGSYVMEGEFRGNPMLIIRQGAQDKFPHQFGLRRAKLILKHIEDIRRFVNKYDRP